MQVARSCLPRLYRHALESIFAFATLSDLHAILAVSRDWNAAVISLKSIGAKVYLNDRDELLQLLRGSLRRHVRSILDGQGQTFRVGWKSREDLPLLAAACGSSFTVLRTRVHLNDSAQTQASCCALEQFKQLRDLHIDGRNSSGPIDELAEAAGINRVIETVGRLNPSTMHWLELRLPYSADLSFAPLSALTQLRDFAFDFNDENHDPSLTSKQFEELRLLSSIRELHRPDRSSFSTDFFVRMLQPGHALSWDRLDVLVNPALAAVISSLPTLTSLRAELRSQNVLFFSTLHALTSVHLVGSEVAIDSTELVRSLSHCAQVVMLRLEMLGLSGRDLETLLPAFPLLAVCRITLCPQLDSLRCFATPALAASLTKLTLYGLPLCPPTEASHLLGLRSLEELYVRLPQPLSAEQQTEFASSFPKRGQQFFVA